MRALLSRDDPPGAVFRYNDLVAPRTALETGRRVPEDVALTGYDDIEEGRCAHPAISTISRTRPPSRRPRSTGR